MLDIRDFCATPSRLLAQVLLKIYNCLYLRRDAHAFGQPRGSKVLLSGQNPGVIVRPGLVKRDPGEMGARGWSASNDCAAKHRNRYPVERHFSGGARGERSLSKSSGQTRHGMALSSGRSRGLCSPKKLRGMPAHLHSGNENKRRGARDFKQKNANFVYWLSYDSRRTVHCKYWSDGTERA